MARKSKKKAQAELPEAPLQHLLEVATLSRAVETTFDLIPDRAALDRIAGYLGLESLSSMRFKGHIQPRKKENWRIEARLTAKLAQACVISLTPVSEQVDEQIERDLHPQHQAKDLLEAEIALNAEDGPDYFEDQIDLAAMALEQLALALDPYPRAPDAAMEVERFAAPGVTPLSDADLKPFAKLADLKAKLENKDS